MSKFLKPLKDAFTEPCGDSTGSGCECRRIKEFLKNCTPEMKKRLPKQAFTEPCDQQFNGLDKNGLHSVCTRRVCTFAHCDHELRERRKMNPKKFKKKECKKWKKDGVCPYGSKCEFKHTETVPTITITPMPETKVPLEIHVINEETSTYFTNPSPWELLLPYGYDDTEVSNNGDYVEKVVSNFGTGTLHAKQSRLFTHWM